MTLGISGGRNSFYLSPASPLLSFRWLCPCEVHTCYLPGQFQQGLGLGIGEAIPFYSILSYPTHPISFHPLPAYPSHPSHPIPFHLISSHPSYSTPLQFSPSHPIPTHHQVLSTHCVLGGIQGCTTHHLYPQPHTGQGSLQADELSASWGVGWHHPMPSSRLLHSLTPKP